MYETHFGLREVPFALTPNTRYFHRSQSHSDALELLRVALREREGFIKVTGEVGTGKTLLCRLLLNALSAQEAKNGAVSTAYIPNPALSPAALYDAVADELGAPVDTAGNAHRTLKAINQVLIARASKGQQVILVIDEAQAMPEPTLEALRLLTNLETERTRLLQVVLFGQPELDLLLDRPGLRQLKQRIAFQYRLAPLDSEGIAQYLRHRLTRAGYNGEDIFSGPAVKLIARASGGIPRLLNILAHKSLLAAWGCGERRVDRRHALRAIRDTESARQPRVVERWL